MTILCSFIQPFVFQGIPRIPILIMEVKRCVSSFRKIATIHLGQVFVQSYYALKNHPLDFIVSCLTDGDVYHFFKIKTASDAPILDIEWVHSVSTVPKAIGAISTFLKHSIKNQPNSNCPTELVVYYKRYCLILISIVYS